MKKITFFGGILLSIGLIGGSIFDIFINKHYLTGLGLFGGLIFLEQVIDEYKISGFEKQRSGKK
jgi:hypothetical protein